MHIHVVSHLWRKILASHPVVMVNLIIREDMAKKLCLKSALKMHNKECKGHVFHKFQAVK
jgi:hypothetical protein